MKPLIAIPVPTFADHAYNAQNWPAYAEAVKSAGGVPVRLELDWSPRALREEARRCEGYLLPGSPADIAPNRYGQERQEFTAEADPLREAVDTLLLEQAEAEEKPLLAICFGMQMMNVWYRGTLLQDLAPMPINHAAGRSVAVAHSVQIAPQSMLSGLIDQEESCPGADERWLPVNSSHHQAVAMVGLGLRVTARSGQDSVVEAIEPEDRTRFMLGVQWHPERTFALSATSKALFKGFVGAAEATQVRDSGEMIANR